MKDASVNRRITPDTPFDRSSTPRKLTALGRFKHENAGGVVAGNPEKHSDANAGSSNVTKDNMFNAPDGKAFNTRGRLWIQTDGRYTNHDSFSGMGNNKMLVGDPETGKIKRFLVTPREAEVTGLEWSPDRKTMFVSIQHPGERVASHFPDKGNSVPRSVIVAVTRDDDGVIG